MAEEVVAGPGGEVRPGQVESPGAVLRLAWRGGFGCCDDHCGKTGGERESAQESQALVRHGGLPEVEPKDRTQRRVNQPQGPAFLSIDGQSVTSDPGAVRQPVLGTGAGFTHSGTPGHDGRTR
jgi:hypothetical protein